MPLSGLQEAVAPGSASTSRKRTYEQITRSESRSVTPLQPPSKRRRTNTSLSRSGRTSLPRRSSSSSFTTTSLPSSAHRFAGDGLDFRRPTSSAMAQAHAQEQNTVDLTLEDDSDEEESGSISHLSSLPASRAGTPDMPPAVSRSRHPQPNPLDNQQRPEPEVITLLSDSEDEDDNEDVQVVGSRRLNLDPFAGRPILPPPRSLSRRLRTPPPELRRSNAQTFADTLRQLPGLFGFGSGTNRFDPTPPTTAPFGGFNIIDHARHIMQSRVPTPLDLATYDDDRAGLADYDNITMDYGAPAFVIEDPGSEEPVVVDEYKPPTPARQGFTKDIEEDGDVLVCCACDDELAMGQDEVKQQVWVVKRCGHVYCGICATRRVTTRGGNARERKRAKIPKHEQLRLCVVGGCMQKLTGTKAMFQIYL